MGIYASWIFPRLVRKCMSYSVLREQRGPLLEKARGEVLEIGFGPGLNLPFYPEAVSRLTAIDSNSGMLELTPRAAASFPVETRVENVERLRFEDAAFDCVVSTWTLCSVSRVDEALREVRRVLRPGGSFLFIEHGLSPDPKERRWQERLTPFHKHIAGGCHLNRDIPCLVSNAGLEISDLGRFYLDKAPRLLGYTFRGQAHKA